MVGEEGRLSVAVGQQQQTTATTTTTIYICTPALKYDKMLLLLFRQFIQVKIRVLAAWNNHRVYQSQVANKLSHKFMYHEI